GTTAETVKTTESTLEITVETAVTSEVPQETTLEVKYTAEMGHSYITSSKPKIARLLESYPEIAQEISSMIRHTSDRSNVADCRLGLLGAIVHLANCHVVATDNRRRRTDTITILFNIRLIEKTT
ncbi:unnamed protein product, partial [Rotaria sp. Silwood1]